MQNLTDSAQTAYTEVGKPLIMCCLCTLGVCTYVHLSVNIITTSNHLLCCVLSLYSEAWHYITSCLGG